MRYTIKAIENLVAFRNHHLSPGVGSFEEFNEDQMVFSGNEREIANGVYEGGDYRKIYSRNSIIRTPIIRTIRLSGLSSLVPIFP